MPTDTNYDRGNLALYQYELNVIKQICNEQDANYVIIGGDFNTDLRRTSSLHADKLLQYMQSECMLPLVNHDKSTVDYTYESKSNSVRSVLDHVIVSENLFNSVHTYDVIHDGCNLSDHSAVVASFNISTHHVLTAMDENYIFPYWQKANEHELSYYRQILDGELDKIIIPEEAILCQDFFCSAHTNDIVCFYDSIVNACLNASDSAIPFGTKSYNGKVGWNSFVKPYKD